jgi:DNA replication protein DnaC
VQHEQALAEFVKGFSCNDPTGIRAACADVEQDDMLPMILYRNFRIPCPVARRLQCAVLGIVKARTKAAEDDYRQREERRARIYRAEQVGVPLIYFDTSLSNCRATKAVEIIRKFHAEEAKQGRGLVLLGPTGVGKTYAAAALLNEVEGCGFFIHAQELARAVLLFEDGEETLQRTLTTPLLILDDFGSHSARDGGMVQAFIDELIAVREANRRATVITSNLTPPELKKRLSARAMDRLRSWGQIYSLDGPSLRQAKP